LSTFSVRDAGSIARPELQGGRLAAFRPKFDEINRIDRELLLKGICRASPAAECGHGQFDPCAGKNGNDEMKYFSIAAFMLMVGTGSLVSASLARAASDCSMSVTLADWGEKSTGYIDLAPKESCQFPVKMPGTISSSDISQKPGRGKLKKINASTYQYTAKARYTGSDTFAITATGKNEKASGTTVISYQVTIK
jgi:hypothetical protein